MKFPLADGVSNKTESIRNIYTIINSKYISRKKKVREQKGTMGKKRPHKNVYKPPNCYKK